jgi:hypothetical protein
MGEASVLEPNRPVYGRLLGHQSGVEKWHVRGEQSDDQLADARRHHPRLARRTSVHLLQLASTGRERHGQLQLGFDPANHY